MIAMAIALQPGDFSLRRADDRARLTIKLQILQLLPVAPSSANRAWSHHPGDPTYGVVADPSPSASPGMLVPSYRGIATPRALFQAPRILTTPRLLLAAVPKHEHPALATIPGVPPVCRKPSRQAALFARALRIRQYAPGARRPVCQPAELDGGPGPLPFTIRSRPGPATALSPPMGWSAAPKADRRERLGVASDLGNDTTRWGESFRDIGEAAAGVGGVSF